MFILQNQLKNMLNNEFIAEMLWCTKCDLCKTRTNVVIGEGNENADIMFIGEAAGKQEDIEGTPFCGRSGKLLRELFKEADIKIENIYIANILKCRPPNNRDPFPEEIKACIPYLKQQIKDIKPKIIIGIGRISSGRIKPGLKISKDHGKIYTLKNGIIFMPIYHPAAILRNPTLRSKTLNDLKQVKNMDDNYDKL